MNKKVSDLVKIIVDPDKRIYYFPQFELLGRYEGITDNFRWLVNTNSGQDSWEELLRCDYCLMWSINIDRCWTCQRIACLDCIENLWYSTSCEVCESNG